MGKSELIFISLPTLKNFFFSLSAFGLAPNNKTPLRTAKNKSGFLLFLFLSVFFGSPVVVVGGWKKEGGLQYHYLLFSPGLRNSWFFRFFFGETRGCYFCFVFVFSLYSKVFPKVEFVVDLYAGRGSLRKPYKCSERIYHA